MESVPKQNLLRNRQTAQFQPQYGFYKFVRVYNCDFTSVDSTKPRLSVLKQNRFPNRQSSQFQPQTDFYKFVRVFNCDFTPVQEVSSLGNGKCFEAKSTPKSTNCSIELTTRLLRVQRLSFQLRKIFLPTSGISSLPVF